MKKFFTATDGTEIEESVALDEIEEVSAEEIEDLVDTEVKAEKVAPVDGVTEIKPEPKKALKANDGTVNVAALNIRADARPNAPVIRVVPINTELRILDETKDFFCVEGPDGVHGFCKKQFVTVK